MSDWFYYVDGELDDVSPEERRAAVERDFPDEFVWALRDEGEEEDVADELACEAEDAARAERGEPDQDARR